VHTQAWCNIILRFGILKGVRSGEGLSPPPPLQKILEFFRLEMVYSSSF